MFRTSLFAVAASIFVLQPAFAGSKIVFDRADLADPEAVAALYAEIEAAARKECKRDLLSSPVGVYQMKSCVKDAVARAVADVGSPELAAYAAGETAEAKDYASAE
ncbi:MAG: UrcA family protein [Pseudomonadota bacterium]|nr:UrcA family protein [Pseudomonadota bacterium]